MNLDQIKGATSADLVYGRANELTVDGVAWHVSDNVGKLALDPWVTKLKAIVSPYKQLEPIACAEVLILSALSLPLTRTDGAKH